MVVIRQPLCDIVDGGKKVKIVLIRKVVLLKVGSKMILYHVCNIVHLIACKHSHIAGKNSGINGFIAIVAATLGPYVTQVVDTCYCLKIEVVVYSDVQSDFLAIAICGTLPLHTVEEEFGFIFYYTLCYGEILSGNSQIVCLVVILFYDIGVFGISHTLCRVCQISQ